MGYETETCKAKDEGDQVEKLKSFIEKEIKSPFPSPESPTMHKVPIGFVNGHRQFFEPKIISIGPLHYQPQKDSPAQELKKLFSNNFIDRLGSNERHPTDRLVQLMSSLGRKSRNLYRDIDHDGDLAKIMLLDGCFIVDLLLRCKDTEDSSRRRVAAIVILLREDLLKIENQLPFSVLQALAMLLGKDQELMGLACKFFDFPMTCGGYTPQHLLELALNSLFPPNDWCPRDPSEQLGSRDAQILRDAKGAFELKLHGIQFERTEMKNGLTKFEFQNGKFKIPQLVVQESTEAIFWNFLIYEMHFSSKEPIFASYVMLMDSLINSEKDVRVLLDANILVPRINDVNSLVALFNNLAANVNQEYFSHVKLIEELNRYCRSSFAPLRAHVVRNYNDMSWNMVNSILLFILTVTQTLFSVLAYKPNGK